MVKRNAITLAKKSTKKSTVKKPTTRKKPVEKTLSVEEQRDLKAKETVQKLLEDSPIITLDKKEELLELDETPIEEPKGIDWLEEQLKLVSEKNELLVSENERLVIENQQLREGTFVSNESDDVMLKVVELFDELQSNHIKLGTDPKTGIGNFRIYCPGFLNRMIKFFPFLNENKKY